MSRYQTRDDDNETRATRCNHEFTRHQRLKSWSVCCKQQPEAWDGQDVQERELVPTCALSATGRDSFLSDSGGAKARLPRHPGLTCSKIQDDSGT